jgi:Cdc6-like AAA superfamily ATPase
MAKSIITDERQVIWLSPPQVVPSRDFVGREQELRLCRAAFGVNSDNRFDVNMHPLHFRLEGPPGVGKNELVYELARQLATTENLEFYSIQGHEEMTPEDLSILIVPDPEGRESMSLQQCLSG